MSQERVDNLFASESWSAVYTAYSSISLKAYDFDTIREALLEYVQQTYPDKFNDFIASSEFIAILDLVAYLGHSLSFRLDMNTRENFLDTAERRESILRMAKNLGYIKTRPINARGYMKITSVTTDQDVSDNEGNSLANTTVNWNDINDSSWYENFITVLDSSFSQNSKVRDPIASLNTQGVENFLYEVNENPSNKRVNYPFSANINGASRSFETAKVLMTDKTISEAEPNPSNNFNIINRNDNLGPASDRTGFFVYTKLGEMKFSDYTFNAKMSNRVQVINAPNVSNTDVWIQKIDSNSAYLSSVAIVDNDSRETAIYNALRNSSGDLASVTTNVDNSIQINFPDGIFGNAAYGNYRIWYRQTDNESFSVNADDISEVSVTVPYIGGDNRPYNITITMSTTRDFSENYAAETFESVRRIAPRSYYSQDRMVNAQDYNIYPLTLGSNVISKSKAVNTSFAGKSRFFEMDDPTGHHSNVSVTGTDGSIYMDEDIITMNLSFNRTDGKSDDFVRNIMSTVIKHPSLMNLYYYTNMFNSNAVISTPNLNFDVHATNLTVIDVSSTIVSPVTYLYPGDHLLTEGTNELEQSWTSVSGTSISEIGSSVDSFVIDNIIPEMTGKIKKVVRGYRTRFEDSEILAIKTQKIEDLSVETFVIKYTNTVNTSSWEWKIHDPLVDVALVPGEDVYITFTYSAGFRANEAEYVATFNGKKVVFESTEQVKFFYSNDTFVVDNETNLANRDILLLNYYTATVSSNLTTVADENVTLNVGTAPVTNIVTVGTGATFDGVYAHTGAELTNEFIENSTSYNPVSTQHKLVSPVGIEYDVTPTAPSASTIIGNSPAYTVSYSMDDLSSLVGTVIDTGEDPTIIVSTEYIYSINPALITSTEDSCAAVTTHTTTYTSNQLTETGMKGVPSTQYFSIASTSNNFVWIDQNELPSGKTLDNAIAPMIGVQTDYVVSFSSSIYEFTFSDMALDGWTINSLDNDIYWKQFAYGEVNFTSLQSITTNNIIIKDALDNIIDITHCELSVVGNNYKIIFWTANPGIDEILSIFIAGSGDADLSEFSVRVERTVAANNNQQTSVETYADIESYISNEFLTPAGYVDYTKVKLFTEDTKRNPQGILQVFSNVDNTANLGEIGDISVVEFSHLILENYTKDGIEYERVSNKAIAYDETQNNTIPYTASIRFLIEVGSTDLSDGIWQKRVSGIWTTNFSYTVVSSDKIIYGGITYRVVAGRSYIEDKFMSFRWDHYADKDKRIDPSTSNIIDMYVLSADYVRRVNTWIANGYSSVVPAAPNNFELTKIMSSIEPKAAISDHISYIPVKFKYLFGAYSAPENQAVFKVVKKLGTSYTDSEIKTAVSDAINKFFNIDNWNFGETFYFSELSSYIHTSLPNHISSVIITPKYITSEFSTLLSISSEPTEIFLSVTTSADVKIITNIVADELLGE